MSRLIDRSSLYSFRFADFVGEREQQRRGVEQAATAVNSTARVKDARNAELVS